MKYVILVGDGMGDLPIAELGGRTPLEAARTPAMDSVARRGTLGLLRTVPSGYPPGSDVANLSLLGYLPQECYSGRAPLEAASLGITLEADELAFRCNLVTLTEENGQLRMADYSAGHITTPEARELIEALNRNLADDHLRFYPGISYRHLLVVKGQWPSLATVPPHDYTGHSVAEQWLAYQQHPLLAEVMTRARQVLASHPVNRQRSGKGLPPANAIWLWGEGRSPSMEPLAARYGLSGALISAVDLLKGIGICAGLEIIEVEGATGYLDTNYQGKAAAALQAAAEKDLVFVHVEAPDEAAHQGSLEKKIQAIEDFDRKIVQPILDGLQKRGPFRLAVVMDHFTPLSLKTHTDQPVPVAVLDGRQTEPVRENGYNEAAAAETGVFFADGHRFFEAFLGD